MCVARHAQITQNNKCFFNEVDFLHAVKHEIFLQIDTMILDGDGQASPKFPK